MAELIEELPMASNFDPDRLGVDVGAFRWSLEWISRVCVWCVMGSVVCTVCGMSSVDVK
jgi:hypothetical protein